MGCAQLRGSNAGPTPRGGIKPAVFAGDAHRDRLFIPSPLAARRRKRPEDPAEVDAALDNFKAVTEAAGLTLAHVVFVNPHLTSSILSSVMNERCEAVRVRQHARSRHDLRLRASRRPHRLHRWAVRDLSRRKAIRPKNTPSPTASPCVFAGDTLYCSAKAASSRPASGVRGHGGAPAAADDAQPAGQLRGSRSDVRERRRRQRVSGQRRRLAKMNAIYTLTSRDL